MYHSARGGSNASSAKAGRRGHPFFLGSHGDIGWETQAEDLAWVTGLPGLALYWYSLLLYIPMGLRALREGRADRAAAAAAEASA